MTQASSFVRVALFATAAIALASACGGQSFSDGGSGGDAGNGQGGTASHGGTSGTAGKGHAGTGTAGTSVGGTAGAGSEACDAPPEPGSCDAYGPSWYHDAASGICRPFVYGGCGGNKNRYPTLEACNQACPGGAPNYDACNTPSDCMVTGTGCCGICDSGNITAHDLIAYNKQYADVLQCGVALKLPPPSGSSTAPVACAPCVPPSGQGSLMYFLPDCVAGQCVVQDIRTSPVTACKSSDECQLRHGTGCCQSCSSADLVAVRNDGSFDELACSGGLPPCPRCVPPPTDALANCSPSGHCEVVIPL